MPLHLMAHPDEVAVVRLEPGTQPTWDWTQGPIGSLTHSSTETSVVCRADHVPHGLTREGPFRAVEVAGPLEFGMIGVLAEILDPLARARVSVLTVSTYDTDWILVPSADIETASDAWRKAGLIITPSHLTGGAGR